MPHSVFRVIVLNNLRYLFMVSSVVGMILDFFSSSEFYLLDIGFEL